MIGGLHGIALTTGRLEDNNHERMFASNADEGGFVAHQDGHAVVEDLHRMTEVGGCSKGEQPNGVGVAAHDLPDFPPIGVTVTERCNAAAIEVGREFA